MKKIGKREDGDCACCTGIEENAEHMLFKCQKWAEASGNVKKKVEVTLTCENLIEVMLGSREYWNVVSEHIKKIVEKIEQEDIFYIFVLYLLICFLK